MKNSKSLHHSQSLVAQDPVYYPIYLSLEGKHCVIVGGGEVAYRKASALMIARAEVTVVAPFHHPKLKALANRGRVSLLSRAYRTSDLKDCFLVIAATDESDVNQRVFQDAKRRRILVNVVDEPHLCNFIVPSVVRQGPLQIAVSTSGKSPLLARRIREDLTKRYGKAYQKLLELIGDQRSRLATRFTTPPERKAFWEQVIDRQVIRWLNAGKFSEVREKVARAFKRHRVES